MGSMLGESGQRGGAGEFVAERAEVIGGDWECQKREEWQDFNPLFDEPDLEICNFFLRQTFLLFHRRSRNRLGSVIRKPLVGQRDQA
jgi:hypothetical protein